MSFVDSLLVSVFGILVVFAVLIALSLFVKVQSVVIGAIEKSKRIDTETNIQITDLQSPQESVELSTGELKLINVDEKTAAMIMAIVSDESGISLSELQFKSIKAL